MIRNTWPEYLKDESLFTNAIRLRYLIWVIQHYIPIGSRVLEAGFGSGATAVLLADLGYRVMAIDIDETLVERLQRRYAPWVQEGRLEIKKADMFALPWEGREFVLAYHQGVLEHFSDEQIVQALREQVRVAQWVIFDVPNHRYGVQPFGDERLLSPAHWRRLIKQSGLRVVAEYGRDVHRWLYFLPFGLFSHWTLLRWPWFGRILGVNSIFVCRSSA